MSPTDASIRPLAPTLGTEGLPGLSSEKLEQLGANDISPVNSKPDLTKTADGDTSDWDHDPRNPRNWSGRKKWTMILIVGLYTFVSPFASAIMSPALPDIAIRFGITNTALVAMTLSIFLLSFAFGPLFLAPLSEIYGRTWIIHVGNLLFLAFNIGCTFSKNTGTLIGMRFVAGFWGSSGIACGGGIIGDLFAPKERAMPMAIFSLGPLLGPAIGPIVGGFMTETVGFKWVFMVIAGTCAFAAVVSIPLFRETYAPVIRTRIASQENDPEAALQANPLLAECGGSKWLYIWTNMRRPFILLTMNLICFMLNLYMAFMFGIYYLMFTTFPEIFSTIYGFDAGITGLCYIGLGVGCVVATVYGGSFANKVYLKLCEKNNGNSKPEFRVPAVIFGSLFVPIGVFWYGWSAQAGIHWIMPIIGTAIFAFGMMTTFLAICLYLVDAFTYAASALAAASVSRCILGFVFPLFGTQMFQTLGYGGGNSLLAGLAIVLGIPFPVFLWFYGEKLRKRSSLTRH